MPKRKLPAARGRQATEALGGKRAEPQRRVRYTWCFKLSLLVASLAVGLLLGEMAVRLSGAAPDVIPIGVASEDNVYQRSTNPILSFEFKPGFHTDDETVPPHYRRINSHGFRDVERTYEKPPGTKRLILLGDSVVVGYGLADTERLMSRELEALYGGGQPVEVLNMAVTGYCTRAEVELLRTKGLRYDPDLVVLVFVENDFRNFNPEAFGADGIASRPAIVNGLFRRSHVFRMACIGFNWFHFGLEADPAAWNQRAIGDNNVVEGLRLFRDLADEHGFMPLVVIWPEFTNDGIEYPAKMFVPDSEELIVQTLAESFGLPVVGLREPFRAHWRAQAPRSNPRLYYTIGDQMHASAAGHNAAAEILHAIIQQRNLLDAEQPLPKTAAGDNATAARSAIEAAEALGDDKADYGLVHINEAIALRREGKLEEAVSELEPVADAESIHADEARLLLAEVLGQQGRYAEAQRRAEQILAEDPDDPQAHFVLAGIYNAQKKFNQAIGHLEKTVALRPENVRAHYNLGMLLVKQENWKEAARHLRATVQLAPGDVQARNLLAGVLVHLGRYTDAIAQYQHTLEVDPANQDARRRLQTLQRHVNQR